MTRYTVNKPDDLKACAERHYTITHKQLPLCCPLPTMEVWDAHPRVYLPIEEEAEVTCPYCSARYTLKE